MDSLKKALFAEQQRSLHLTKECSDARDSFNLCNATLTSYKKNYALLEKDFASVQQENESLQRKLRSCEFSCRQKDLQIRNLTDQLSRRAQDTTDRPWCCIKFLQVQTTKETSAHFFTVHFESNEKTPVTDAELDARSTVFFSTGPGHMATGQSFANRHTGIWEFGVERGASFVFIVATFGGKQWFCEAVPLVNTNGLTRFRMFHFDDQAQNRLLFRHQQCQHASVQAKQPPAVVEVVANKKRKSTHAVDEPTAKRRKTSETDLAICDLSAAGTLCNMLASKEACN